MKYNTCFFERYASLVIREFLGERYANLENIDRPDLQDNTLGIGIEVTRAIQENKNFANSLINDMAADEILKVDKSLLSDIQRFGYAYGLEGDFLGHYEYDYWNLALPFHRVVESKVRKVIGGFYGDYKEFGLFVFSKENLQIDDIYKAMNFTVDLQQGERLHYDFLFVNQSDHLFVCDLQKKEISRYNQTIDQRRDFFIRSAVGE